MEKKKNYRRLSLNSDILFSCMYFNSSFITKEKKMSIKKKKKAENGTSFQD